MPLIPAHFIIAKSEASFVNTQVITDKIQNLIKKEDSLGIRLKVLAHMREATENTYSTSFAWIIYELADT